MSFVQRYPSTWGQSVRPVAVHLQPQLNLLGQLLKPREVIELRVSEWSEYERSPRLIANGYFCDPLELADAVVRYADQPISLALVANPVRRSLLSAAANTLRQPAAWTSVASDVTRRVALPIRFHLDPDFFPEMAEPRALILRRVQHCQHFLTQRHGWPEPAIVDSGYAMELLYRIDLPNTPASTALIEQLLDTLDQRFSDDTAFIDTQAAQAVYTYPVLGVDMYGPETEVVHLPDTLHAVNLELLQVTADDQPPMNAHAMVDGIASDPSAEAAFLLEADAWIHAGELYAAYLALCRKCGLHPLPITHFARRPGAAWHAMCPDSWRTRLH